MTEEQKEALRKIFAILQPQMMAAVASQGTSETWFEIETMKRTLAPLLEGEPAPAFVTDMREERGELPPV